MNSKNSIYNDEIRFFVTPAGPQSGAVVKTELSPGTQEVVPPIFERAKKLLNETVQVKSKIDAVTPEWHALSSATNTIDSIVDHTKITQISSIVQQEATGLGALATQETALKAALATAQTTGVAADIDLAQKNLDANINAQKSLKDASDKAAFEVAMRTFEIPNGENLDVTGFAAQLGSDLENALVISMYREQNPGSSLTDDQIISDSAITTIVRNDAGYPSKLAQIDSVFTEQRRKDIFLKAREEFKSRKIKSVQKQIQDGKITIDEAKKQIGFGLADKLVPAKVDEKNVGKAVETYHEALREPNGALKDETLGDLNELLTKVTELGNIDPATMFQLQGTLEKLRRLGEDNSTEVEAQMVAKALQSYETTMARTAKEYEVVALDAKWNKLVKTLKEAPKHIKTALKIVGIVAAPWLAASLLAATAAGTPLLIAAGLLSGGELYAAIMGYDYLKRKSDVNKLKEREQVNKEQLALMVAYKNAKDGLEGTGKEWVKAIEAVKLELKKQIFKGMDPVAVTDTMLDKAIDPYLPKQDTSKLQSTVSNLTPKVT